MSEHALDANDFARRWGHYGSHILVVLIGGVVVLTIYPPQNISVHLLSSLALMLMTLTTFYYMRQHDRGLCEACMHSMPLDASERAERYVMRFKVAHLAEKPVVVLAYFGAMIASAFALWPYGTVGQALWGSLLGSLVYMILSASTHRLLQPWCPQCSGGGEGDREDDPVAPEPLPYVTA